MSPTVRKELVILVADLDMDNALRGILRRHQALGIRSLSTDEVDIYRHEQRDSGCYGDAHEFLRPFMATHRLALVMFDRHGSGQEHLSAPQIESEVEIRLSNTGWSNRCSVIVPDPELEIWIWSDSPHVDAQLGWSGGQPPLRQWLVSEGLLHDPTRKPCDPKKAMLQSLRQQGKPLSSRLYRDLAEQVSLERCRDRAFLKLKKQLQDWFAMGCT